MKVYLVQHGEAKTEEEDPERPLSKKGLKDVQKVAAFLAGAGVKVARVLHSGKKRALETAEILSTSIGPERKVDEVGGLKPLDDPRIWFERILKAEKDTMLVGHLPYMSRLASLLLKGDAERNAVNFKQGSVVCLEDPGDGNFSVEWMVTPDLVPEE
jgi:phosphohistidine phosphatase